MRKYIIKIDHPATGSNYYFRIHGPKYKNIDFAKTRQALLSRIRGIVKALKSGNFEIVDEYNVRIK
jgi:hypothetical protein